MTDDRMALQQADAGTFLRSIALMVLQIRMAAVEGLIGAGRHERSGACPTWCRGCRDSALDARLGQRHQCSPKRRTGSWLPPFLEAGKTTEKALISMIQEVWIAGVSTLEVDDLVQAPPGPAHLVIAVGILPDEESIVGPSAPSFSRPTTRGSCGTHICRSRPWPNAPCRPSTGA